MKRILFVIGIVFSVLCGATAQSFSIPVKATSPIEFNPTQVIIKVVGNNFMTGSLLLYVETHDSNWDKLDTAYYTSFDFSRKANMKVPSAALLGAVQNGVPNVSLYDQFLQPFGLQVDTVRLKNLSAQ